MKITTQPTSLYIAIVIALGGISIPATYAADKTTNLTPANIYSINILSTTLETALALFTEQSKVQIIVPSELIRNKQSKGLKGQYTATQALSQILQGSGLDAKFINEKTIAITTTDSGQRVLDAVRVEGSNQAGNGGIYSGGINSADLSSLTGANGSRDLTATEGNNSYAQGNVSVGGNRPIAAQKVTQNVTVVGHQELQDKKAMSLTDALTSAAGVISFGANNAVQESGFYTRGQRIDNYTVNGVSSNNTSPNSFASDIALYDHVEILKGGDAFKSGSNSANPSASINLVRKRPLEFAQTTLDISAGSWDHFRQVFDTTGPLNQEATLRGRFIVTNDLNQNFWNNGDASKQVVNGQLEYDFSDKTTLNIGINGGYAKSKPWSTSVLNEDGFNFPRDFSVVFGGNKREDKSAGINFSLDHQFNNQWSLKLQGNKDWNDIKTNTAYLSFPYNEGTSADKYTNNYVDYYASGSDMKQSSESVEGSILGNLKFFDLDQSVELTSSYYSYKSKSATQSDDGNRKILEFDDFRNINFGSIFPDINHGVLDYSNDQYKKYSSYLKLDLQPLKGLHILTGPRWTRVQPVADNNGDYIGKAENNIKIPYSSIRYDVNNNFSVYGSYSDLFQNQNELRTRNSKALDPKEGNSQELGIKFSNDEKNLTGTFAVFKSKIKNAAYTDCKFGECPPEDGDKVYYINTPYEERNKGIEFELAGQITPYWQTSIGYALTKKSYSQTNNSDSLLSDSPWHVKFSNQFKLKGNSTLEKITLGFNTTYISKRSEQEYKSVLLGITKEDIDYLEVLRNAADISGNWDEFDAFAATLDPTKRETKVIERKVKPYAVTDIFARYQINNNWSAQFNVNNVFDKKYTNATFPLTNGSGFYGTPINYLLTLQGKF